MTTPFSVHDGGCQGNTNVLNSSIPILIVVCGPTATGKSGLAIALAQRLAGVILSADSRQVYRDFDIGTAKPTPAELQQIPHHLIDICQPTDTFTVAEFQQQAQALIAQCHCRGAIPLLVGGTGLYIKSVTHGMMIPRVPPQPVLRSQLQALGQFQCYGWLQQVDPIAAAKIHPRDQVRTLRSLEVFYTTGQPISQQQGEHPPTYPILYIGLDCSQDGESDRLTTRIAQRTTQMMQQGLIEEVARLCQQYGEDLPLLNTLGYQEVRQYLNGTLSLAEAEALTVLHTRQFAKRQRTWFRGNSKITWFDSDCPNLLERVYQHIEDFMQRVRPNACA